jgi:hypothetical protein
MISIASVLFLLPLALSSKASAASALNAPLCKAAPQSPSWPSEKEWNTLNTTLGGQLLRPLAPAAPCHSGQASYNDTVCHNIRTSFANANWHAQHPTSTLFQNWNGFSCSLDSTTPCSVTGYPVYVVNATSPEHVRLAVEFAKANNIRLNVKSTGHDYLGR